MSSPAPKKQHIDETRIGEHAAMQPLSGVIVVGETFAVNGTGRGGFVRKEEAEQNKNKQ
jgi:hypothetical protein